MKSILSQDQRDEIKRVTQALHAANTPFGDGLQIVTLIEIRNHVGRIADALEWRNRDEQEKIEYAALLYRLRDARFLFEMRDDVFKNAPGDADDSYFGGREMRRFHVDRLSEAEKVVDLAVGDVARFRMRHPELKDWMAIQDATFEAAHPGLVGSTS